MAHLYSTLERMQDLAAALGKERGRPEGIALQLGKLLSRHGKRRWGQPPPEVRRLHETLMERAGATQFERMLGRFLAANGWEDLYAGIAPPEHGPVDPDWLVPITFDPQPPTNGIDFIHKVGLINSSEEMIIHMRLQKRYEDNIGAIMHQEARSREKATKCKVLSLVVLPWPSADGPAMTGRYQTPAGTTFRYEVSRIWERRLDEMFTNFITTIFAPMTRDAKDRLPQVLRRVDECMEMYAPSEEMKENGWFIIYQSLGAVYPPELIDELLAFKLPYIYNISDCRSIRSEGYAHGRHRGREEGFREATVRWVLQLGGERLGEPPAELAKALPGIKNLDRLEQMAARVLTCQAWNEVTAQG